MKQIKKYSAVVLAAVFIGGTMLTGAASGPLIAYAFIDPEVEYEEVATQNEEFGEETEVPVLNDGVNPDADLEALPDLSGESDWADLAQPGDEAEEPAIERLAETVVEVEVTIETATVTLDIATTAITISSDGYRLADGETIPHTGAYQLVQSDATAAGPLKIEDGIHHLVIENLQVDQSQQGGAALEIGALAAVTLELSGSSSFRSGTNCAGIQLLTDRAKGQEARLTITGSGSLEAYGGTSGAGIGGGYEASNGQVLIESGTVYAEGGAGGAGIGGGNNSSSYKINDCDGGVITISGGRVTALGGNSAAGIGGGNHGDGGAITITGGVVELAQGGGGGAGIGSGLGSHVKSDKGPGFYTGGQITLSGDYLIKQALGGGNAAGIGGGMYADSGQVVIRGGHIELAQGGAGTAGSYHHGAAGIGAGYQGHCDVFIRLAHIEKAIGSFSGAGIGSGATANYSQRENPLVAGESNVFICSSYIDLAQGGEYGGAGIGGGVSCDYVTVTLCGHVIVAKGGPGGAGVGSGLYNETYKYAEKTTAVVNINCGALEAEGGGDGADVGPGAGNEEPDVVIDTDETDLSKIPSVPTVAADGYEGFYDGQPYGINVAIANASIAYALLADGPYEAAKPLFTEVGEYLTYYRADKAYYTFYGVETVLIKPLSEEGGGGKDENNEGSSSGGSSRNRGGATAQPQDTEVLAELEEPVLLAEPAVNEEPDSPTIKTASEVVVSGESTPYRVTANAQPGEQKINPQTGTWYSPAAQAGRLLIAVIAAAIIYLLLKQGIATDK